jgi:hypothetical protein
VSRVLGLLTGEGLVTRAEGAGVLDVEWEALIRRWTQDYAMTTSNTASTWLAVRGLPAAAERLVRYRRPYAVTSSFAAARIAPVTEPRLLVIYVDDVSDAASRLDLRAADAGANVLLMIPYDPVVYERTVKREDLDLVNPSQLAADLLTSPGRGPSEAEALLRWMRENPDAWRS